MWKLGGESHPFPLKPSPQLHYRDLELLSDGIRPDLDKLSAVRDAEVSADKTLKAVRAELARETDTFLELGNVSRVPCKHTHTHAHERASGGATCGCLRHAAR